MKTWIQYGNCRPPVVPHRQRGATMVLMAVALLMLLAFTALAVDGGNLYVARNELQNSADAGALAGARTLYLPDGSQVNAGANQVARDTAASNQSQGDDAEVVSVLRGHWSFTDRTFTPNPSLEPVDLAGKTTQELDLDLNFINAVEVVTARDQTPVEAFFGRVLGFDSYEASARAVAYIGFAGKLRPEDVDQPIAMCRQALLDNDGSYDCNVGRFIPEGDQTGGWTNFDHDDTGSASNNEVSPLVCGDGNPNEMYFGEDIGTNNGQINDAYKKFYDCWVEKTNQQEPWSMTLPVVDCEEGISPKNPLVGAVELNVIWVTASPVSQIDNLPTDKNPGAPTEMLIPPEDADSPSPGTWSSSDADGANRWSSFVDQFNLREPSGEFADWHDKTIYFLPSCSYHEPKGNTGGENYGILAQIPVLVD